MGLEGVANLFKLPSSYSISGCQAVSTFSGKADFLELHALQDNLATNSEATRSLTSSAGLSSKFLGRLNFRPSLGGQLSELFCEKKKKKWCHVLLGVCAFWCQGFPSDD